MIRRVRRSFGLTKFIFNYNIIKIINKVKAKIKNFQKESNIMEQNKCEQCGTIIEDGENTFYGFCSKDCYFEYMAQNNKENLSMAKWDWS
jgi:hypothetical protein